MSFLCFLLRIQCQFWCEEASATVIRVGKYSAECKTREAVEILYKQFNKFIVPIVPQQEERIQQIMNLAKDLYGKDILFGTYYSSSWEIRIPGFLSFETNKEIKTKVTCFTWVIVVAGLMYHCFLPGPIACGAQGEGCSSLTPWVELWAHMPRTLSFAVHLQCHFNPPPSALPFLQSQYIMQLALHWYGCTL